ncbi:hypothetical protein DFR49_3264 [Hephaestia caeni]|uniref:Uncharacterized protein n=1 Tax=Hephaestia caeni TaxID=645617 RepID=A0A397NIP6_9SPHN|nr:hypothetical protein [Hephaestia caeni]RIA37380.1 hypothetical protein DFR49_3264 [Hephaestia caeni]
MPAKRIVGATALSDFIRTAPLGALLRYSDGQPRPPARFNKKLAAWERTNGVGRLIKKTPTVVRPSYTMPEGFTLHHGDFGSSGIIVTVVTMTYHVTSPLHFEIVEQPAPGMVRVLTQWEGVDELRHLAPDMATAQSWFASHRYSNARFEVVGDEANPILPELGRAA